MVRAACGRPFSFVFSVLALFFSASAGAQDASQIQRFLEHQRQSEEISRDQVFGVAWVAAYEKREAESEPGQSSFLPQLLNADFVGRLHALAGDRPRRGAVALKTIEDAVYKTQRNLLLASLRAQIAQPSPQGGRKAGSITEWEFSAQPHLQGVKHWLQANETLRKTVVNDLLSQGKWGLLLPHEVTELARALDERMAQIKREVDAYPGVFFGLFQDALNQKPAELEKMRASLEKNANELAARISEIRKLKLPRRVPLRIVMPGEDPLARLKTAHDHDHSDAPLHADPDSKAVVAVDPALSMRMLKKIGLHTGEITAVNPAKLQEATQKKVGKAFYVPSQNTAYVYFWNLCNGGDLMYCLTHEMSHAFQEQNYGLSQSMAATNADEQLARLAVVEGEASYVGHLAFMRLNQANADAGTSQDPFASEWQARITAPKNPKRNFEGVIYQKTFFPYAQGSRFIQEIVKKKGWGAVNRLFTDAPVRSTAQILHPELWINDVRPVVFEPNQRSFDELKSIGWLKGTVGVPDVLGEAELRWIFECQGLDPASTPEIDTALTGWSGGAYFFFGDGSAVERLILSVATIWQTDRDAKEFESAYIRMLQMKYPSLAAAELSDRMRVEREGKTVFILEGPESRDITLDAQTEQLLLRVLQPVIR